MAAAVLAEALGGADGIACAFVFGSLAAGVQRSDSDVDLLVLGSIDGRSLSRRVSRSSDTALGRVLNYVLYSEEEWRERLRARNHFVLSVLERPKLFVVGSEADLERLRV